MKYLLSLLVLLFVCNDGTTQGICSGSLGDNIFTRGDFGRGTFPVLLTDPGIAPGYVYTTSVPGDGFYTICSSTGALNGLYPTWLNIRDNSADPNGYMMVVNASFDPGIFYEEVVDGLCENTLYEFSADIINLIRSGTSNHLDPNVSFLIDDEIVYTTGSIPKTERWGQYGFSFVTDASQTSITLTLRNNAPGGIGNDLALDNISFRPCGPSSFIGIDNDTTFFLCIDDDPLTITADIDAAEGQEFAIQWQESQDGLVWEDIADSTRNELVHSDFNPGTYYYRYVSAGNEVNILNEKCRIISDLIEVTILPDTYMVSDTICDGLVYEFGPQQIDQSGFYEQEFQSQYACDSIVLLDLVFVPPQPFAVKADLVDPSCIGDEDGAILVEDVNGGYGEVAFELFNEESELVSSNLPAGNYTLRLVDKYGCVDEIPYTLFDPPEISVDLGRDTAVRLGDCLLLVPEYSTVFNEYVWEGQGTFSCPDCAQTEFIPFTTGLLSVTATDENGCTTNDIIMVGVEDRRSITLPNVFSPNEDNVNDLMTLHYYGKSVAEVVEFQVFDRWGGIVHSISGTYVENGGILWDGYSLNQKVAQGIYTYRLRVRLLNGSLEEYVDQITVIY